jgi:hypothetical protein
MTREQRLNAGVLLGLLVAVYVGFRMPNLWSLNYYIPSGFEGIWRRGLIGALLHPVGNLRFDYHFVAALQGAVLLAVVVLLVRHALRSDWRIKTLTILFLLAPTGGYLFHEVGYIEQLLYLVLLGALAFEDRRHTVLVLAVTLFIHEMAALTIIPLYLALLVIERRHRMAIEHTLALLVVFAVLYRFAQTPDPAAVDQLIEAIKAHANYPLRADYYDVYRHRLTGPELQLYFVSASWWQLTVAGTVAVLTASAFVRRDPIAAGAVVLACLAPLALGFLGWDQHRWVFVSLCSSFLVLVRFGGAQSAAVTAAVSAVLAVFLIVGHLVYFDDYQPRPLLPFPDLPGFLLHGLPEELARIPKT